METITPEYKYEEGIQLEKISNKKYLAKVLCPLCPTCHNEVDVLSFKNSNKCIAICCGNEIIGNE